MSPITNQPLALDRWNGCDYSHNSSGQQNLANHIISLYTFNPHEKVLDIGCGDGQVTQQIGKFKVPKGNVIGIDPSTSMIACASAQNRQNNVTFINEKAETFHFNEQFDTIVSFSALHWVPDQGAAWKNIRSHLKIGGRAIISLNPLPRSIFLTNAIEETTQNQEFHLHFEGFEEKVLMPQMSIEEYEQIVLKSGLQIIKCEQSTKYFEYSDQDAFAMSLKAWLPHVAQLPEEKRDHFVKAIALRFPAQPKLDYNHFIVHAVRNS